MTARQDIAYLLIAVMVAAAILGPILWRKARRSSGGATISRSASSKNRRSKLVSDAKEQARAGMDAQIRSVMNVIEESGESMIQSGVDADAVVRGTLLAAMFLGSPLADYSRLSQWLRDTAQRLDESAGA